MSTPNNTKQRPAPDMPQGASKADGASKEDGAISDADINTRKQTGNDAADAPRQPHERDESPDSQHNVTPREDMRQAARDLQQGQVDTDMRGMRGQETVDPASAATSAAAKTNAGTTRSESGKHITPPEKSRGER